MHRSALLPLLLLAPALAAQTDPPAANAPEVRLVRPSGLYADLPEMGLSLTSLLAGGAAPKSFYEFRDRVAELAEDASTKQVLLDLTGSPLLELPHISELARTIDRLRGAGKRVVAYLENAGLAEYQLASRCDRILMADMGSLDLRSLSLQSMHFKDALDLLGVHFDVVRCGDFKGAVEPFVLPQMSTHLRQHYEAMLRSMNRELVERVAQGRKLAPERVRELQTIRLLQAPQALELGLVDALVPWEGARRALARDQQREELPIAELEGRKSKRSFNPMALLGELFGPKREKELETAGLAVLHLSGQIVDGDKSVPGTMVSMPAVRAIDQLRTDEQVKGVVVRINSPGGSATASEAILIALRRLAKSKPVVVSMGELAASGGYWITCLGRPILAEPGTITGSIGVFGMKPSLGALLRRVGVQVTTVALDAGAGYDAIDEPWSDEHKQRMQQLVDAIYDRFLGNVAASRKLDRAAVEKIAGGRVWSGAQAVDLGLVDRIGGLDDALAAVAKEAGLAEGYEVEHFPRPKSFFETFAESMTEIRALLPERIAWLARGHELRAALLLLREGLAGGTPKVWALLGEDLRIR